MKFNNRQNECITHPETKRPVFLSRSVAVVIRVIKGDQVLLVKRGTSVSDTGKWCMPCGYLDYDETLKEAAMRELYEETGYIANPDNFIMKSVDDNPSSNLQNISFVFNIDFDKLKTDNEWQMDLYEVTEMGFFNQQNSEHMEFAFNHKDLTFKLY
jgi:8-oxo-dGTP pyrophosphatase MutT (NUDIX family)